MVWKCIFCLFFCFFKIFIVIQLQLYGKCIFKKIKRQWFVIKWAVYLWIRGDKLNWTRKVVEDLWKRILKKKNLYTAKLNKIRINLSTWILVSKASSAKLRVWCALSFSRVSLSLKRKKYCWSAHDKILWKAFCLESKYSVFYQINFLFCFG